MFLFESVRSSAHVGVRMSVFIFIIDISILIHVSCMYVYDYLEYGYVLCVFSVHVYLGRILLHTSFIYFGNFQGGFGDRVEESREKHDHSTS